MRDGDVKLRAYFSHILLQVLITSRIFLEKPVLTGLVRQLTVNGWQNLAASEH
jgi:hypothetical protein